MKDLLISFVSFLGSLIITLITLYLTQRFERKKYNDEKELIQRNHEEQMQFLRNDSKPFFIISKVDKIENQDNKKIIDIVLKNVGNGSAQSITHHHEKMTMLCESTHYLYYIYEPISLNYCFARINDEIHLKILVEVKKTNVENIIFQNSDSVDFVLHYDDLYGGAYSQSISFQILFCENGSIEIMETRSDVPLSL